MSWRRLVTLTVTVGAALSLVTFPVAIVVALALEWRHNRPDAE